MLTLADLTSHQNKAIDRLYDHDETLLIAPKGFGKCVVGFTAAIELIDAKVLSKVLILSTAQVCTMTWTIEQTKWKHLANSPTFCTVCLTGNSIDKRKKLMLVEPDIVICNFENLAWLMDNYSDYGFDGLLIDEITKLKSVGGVGFKKLRYKIKNFKWRVGMSADPIAQESQDIYGQMLILDCGKRLGRNKENFLRKYFMQMDYMGFKWEPQPGGIERLTKDLSDVIYRADDTDYNASLPLLIDQEIRVELPRMVHAGYLSLIKQGVLNIQEYEIEAPNEAALQGKLLQICCGAIYHDKNNELGPDKTFDKKEALKNKEKICISLHDEKMKALDKLLKNMHTPVLIAYLFNFQKDALIKRYNAPVFSAKNNKQLLQEWEAGKLPMMLIHPKSAGHGLNLQYGSCNTLICMSYFWSADEWEQLIGRILRQGQEAPIVNRYTIICVNTLEDIVMKDRLINRNTLSKQFHEYLKQFS